MTTAHRPTWAPAKGREHQGGARLFGPSAKVSKLEANGFLTLKTRARGQSAADELLERDFARELAEKEREAAKKASGGGVGGDVKALGGAEGDAGAGAFGRFAPREEDADDDDDDGGDGASDGESDSDSDSESDDDDTAALLAELERIKAERAKEAAEKAAAEQAAAEHARADELATGNPLLDLADGGSGAPANADFKTKRRWDDDVVFRNQARDAPKVGKRFINDTIRSDFHKRFLNKYIK